MCSLGGRCLEIRARDARTWVICDSFELCLSADRRWKDGIGTSDMSQAGEQKNVVCGANHSQHAHLMQRFQISFAEIELQNGSQDMRGNVLKRTLLSQVKSGTRKESRPSSSHLATSLSLQFQLVSAV